MRFREVLFDLVKGRLMLFLPPNSFTSFSFTKSENSLVLPIRVEINLLKNNLLDPKNFGVLSCFVELWLK